MSPNDIALYKSYLNATTERRRLWAEDREAGIKSQNKYRQIFKKLLRSMSDDFFESARSKEQAAKLNAFLHVLLKEQKEKITAWADLSSVEKTNLLQSIVQEQSKIMGGKPLDVRVVGEGDELPDTGAVLRNDPKISFRDQVNEVLLLNTMRWIRTFYDHPPESLSQLDRLMLADESYGAGVSFHDADWRSDLTLPYHRFLRLFLERTLGGDRPVFEPLPAKDFLEPPLKPTYAKTSGVAYAARHVAVTYQQLYPTEYEKLPLPLLLEATKFVGEKALSRKLEAEDAPYNPCDNAYVFCARLFELVPFDEGYAQKMRANAAGLAQKLKGNPSILLARRDWKKLPLAQKENCVRKIAALVDPSFDAFGFSFLPSGSLSFATGKNNYGTYEGATDTLRVNLRHADLKASFFLALDATIHEKTHQHQRRIVQAYRSGRLDRCPDLQAQAKIFDTFFEDDQTHDEITISPRRDPRAYAEHPIEREARAVAAMVLRDLKGTCARQDRLTRNSFSERRKGVKPCRPFHNHAHKKKSLPFPTQPGMRS